MNKTMLARAVPDFALDRQEVTLALAGRELSGHDGVGVVNEILGRRENANDPDVVFTGEDSDPSSIGTERRMRDRWLGSPCIPGTGKERDFLTRVRIPKPDGTIQRRCGHHVQPVGTERGRGSAGTETPEIGLLGAIPDAPYSCRSI